MNYVYNRYWIFIWLFLCVLSRLFTSIYYIEDPDSLRFALASEKYSIEDLQPHFPGYPVFCFFVSILTALIGKFSLAFSFIGGISIFVIIWCSRQIVSELIPEMKLWILDLLLFFNPLLWLMSNRYMPDIMGLAFVLIALYLYVCIDKRPSKQIIIILLAQFVTGASAGVRLSYFPLLIVPSLSILFFYKDKLLQIVALAAGVLTWFIPLILVTGWEDFILSAKVQSAGHFYEWGGTVLTENSYIKRLIAIMEGIWADGFGCFLAGRHWITLFVSMGFAIGILSAIKNYKSLLEKLNSGQKQKIVALLTAFVIYILWIYFFQNVIYQPRHVLPLIVMFCIIVSIGYSVLSHNYKVLCYLLLIYFFISYSTVSGVLVYQHRSPTAIAEVLNYLRKKSPENKTVIAIPLINYYLSTQGLNAKYLSPEKDKDAINSAFATDQSIYVVGQLPEYITLKPLQDRSFYHNPYVNRIWSNISLYEFSNAK